MTDQPSIPGAEVRTVNRPDGVQLHVQVAGPADGRLVVLAHGFPELGYSWRHQVPALVAAGYRVVVPDQRGYGRSSAAAGVEAYDIVHLTDDLMALVDDAGRERAAIVGHDWGSMVVWASAQRFPERVAGVMGMSVPFLPRGDHPPISAMRHVLGDAFFYMLYFQEPGVADANLGADPEATIRGMLLGISPAGTPHADPGAMFVNDGRGFVERLPVVPVTPDWITDDEIAVYVEEFRRTGFTGGINWYRNLDRNWELLAPFGGQKVQPPAAFIGGAQDPVLMMTPPERSDGWLADDRGRTIVPEAGHWVQQETPEVVNQALLTFLDGLGTW